MQTLDFKIVHAPLKLLLQDVESELLMKQKTNSKNKDLAVICELFLKAADNNYDAIRCLVVKDPKFSTPALIICRSNLDLVFTLCLIFANPSKYVSMYKKSGWREKYEELLYQRTSIWMNTNQPDWLEKYGKYVDLESQVVGITSEEKQNLKKISYFPTPSQILNINSKYWMDLSDSTRLFLRKLMTEHYKHLSQLMHISSPGLAMHIAPTLPKFSKEKKEILLADPIYISWACLLSLLAEINIYFGYKHGPKLKELWTYLNLTIPVCDEIYSARYKTMLV